MPDGRRPEDLAGRLLARIGSGAALAGGGGRGSVGSPLAAARAGLPVPGFDVDAERVARFDRGESFNSHSPTNTRNVMGRLRFAAAHIVEA